MRADDVIARFGGDEFVLILRGLNPESLTSQGRVICERLLEQMQKPFLIDQTQYSITTSMGCCPIYLPSTQSLDAWIAKADAALREAKLQGPVQTGKLKALAVTGKARHPMMPNVPTVAEAGLPGFELESWVALYAPAGTPAAIVNKLTQDVKKALELPEAKQRGDAAGIEVRYLNPQGTDALLKKEIALMQKAIKSANIKLD